MADEFNRWLNQKAMPKCETCLFWHALSPDGQGIEADGNYDVTDDGAGRCRRFPPVGRRHDAPAGRHALDTALWAEWPLTTDEDWCGEHSERAQEPR